MTLVILLLVCGSFPLTTCLGLLDTRSMLRTRIEMMATLQQSIARLKAKVVSSNPQPSPENPFLTGETDTIAAAAFQAKVLKITEANSATVYSAQARPQAKNGGRATYTPTAAAPGQKITMEMTFTAHMDDIQKILFQIETGNPVAFITEMRMQPVKSVQAGNVTDEDALLHVVIALYGFWRP